MVCNISTEFFSIYGFGTLLLNSRYFPQNGIRKKNCTDRLSFDDGGGGKSVTLVRAQWNYSLYVQDMLAGYNVITASYLSAGTDSRACRLRDLLYLFSRPKYALIDWMH